MPRHGLIRYLTGFLIGKKKEKKERFKCHYHLNLKLDHICETIKINAYKLPIWNLGMRKK